MTTTFNVNGKSAVTDATPNTPLLWVLREDLQLTGTKYGCGVAQCGACTVHVNDVPVRSCSMPVNQVAGKQVTTIEGLSPTGTHKLQKAWVAEQVPQCGYCQSGQIMAAAALVARTPKPTDDEIVSEMTNICRCGTYNRIKAAIKQATGAAG
jgi:isoquinoline 1-oxidoreductase alpha subunit